MTDSDPGNPRRSGAPAFFKELRRRRVIRTTLYYVGGSVATVEAADAFAAPLGLPQGTVRALAILAVCGLPLALALSWTYDVSADPDDAPLGRAARGILLAAAAGIALATAVALWSRGPATPPARPPATGIAVLAFEAPGASTDLRVLAEHLHGRLIDGLSAAVSARGVADSERLRVISRAGVLPFSGGRVTVDSISRALGVGIIVEGTLEQAADSVRIRLRLIDARTSDQLDSRVASAPLNDPVALADNLGETAVMMLRTQLGDVVQERARRLGTRNPEAFRHLVLADGAKIEFASAMIRQDLEGARRSLAAADSFYQEAARLDRAWSEPLVEQGFLSDEHAQLSTAQGTPNARAAYERGLSLAQEALDLSPSDRRALHLRGQMRSLVAGLTEAPELVRDLRAGGEADLRVAILGSPAPASALRHLSELLASEGRLEEALEFGNRAYAEDRYLENQGATLLRLFQYSLRLGRDSEAQRHCAEGSQRFASAPFEDCHLVLMAWSDLVMPNPDSAWATMSRELDAYPAALRPRLEPRLNALVAAVLAGSGLPDSARTTLARARAADPGTRGVALASAGTHSLLGDLDEALEDVRWLLTNFPAQSLNLGEAPELRKLRELPAFQSLVASADSLSRSRD